MRYFSLIFAALLLITSCDKEKREEKLATSQNQQQIVHWFNEIRLQSIIENDSVNLIKMGILVKNEPAEYKAMFAISNGIYLASNSSYQIAIKNFEKALLLVKKPKADSLQAIAYSGIGNCYKNVGNYPKALENLYKALRIFERRKNISSISHVYAFIGEVHAQKNDFVSAKENLKTAMKILDKNKALPGWLTAAHTLANVYGMNGDFESALKIDEEGLRISDSIKSKKMKVAFLDNKANCYLYSNKLDSAQYYFEACLKIDIQIGNRKQIADTYSNLGNLASFKKDYKTAEILTLKSIDILESTGNKFNLGKSYQILFDIYKRQGNFKKALEAHETFYDQYKKLIDEKKEASLAEFKVLHDTEKKEKQLAQNKVLLLEKDADVEKRNNLLIVLSLLVFFIVMIGLLIYRQQRLKNRQQEQEHELKTAISVIETQNKLQNQRLAISRDLHDNIGAQLTFIISSVDNIKYAFDISNTKLDAKLHTINDFAKDTIVELRDTIWAMNNSEIMFEDLKIRILNFIEKAKIVRENVGFKFSIESEINSLTMGSIPGMNIYRTIQEAVNNALKYADASEISIEIKPSDADIKITIIDNGSGFNTETVEKGNGFGNMEKRITDIGGTISVDSVISTGTTITILLPKNVTGIKPQ